MPAPNKHKQKASREWQKKHGQVQPKMTRKQKEKENLKKLDSNWDRYELVYGFLFLYRFSGHSKNWRNSIILNLTTYNTFLVILEL